ncbi:MAG: NAD-dependent epimerase/dehydratase family protein [Deltaproteobacteria bacterium]|nr:NAD-dependent epimerase/dehydratase family protein [Deltaproteobacteria bacterium]
MNRHFSKDRGTCLVLGGCGFIGSHIVDNLLESGYSVRVFDKLNVDTRNIDHVIDDVEIETGDFCNETDVSRAIKGADYVFHFINTTLPKTSTDNPVYDVESNVVSSLKLLDLASRDKVRKIIFASSGGTIYGVPQSIPIPEDHPTNPTCSYGISKLMIEKYLELYRITRRLDYVSFRMSNLYGERQNPHAIQGAVAVFLGLAREGKPITIWGNGAITRDYLYVRDVLSVLVGALEVQTHAHIFNLGSGHGTTLDELTEVIREVSGKTVEVIRSEGRPIDVPVNVLDISRVRNEFDFAPQTSLRQGVKKTWEWLNNSA